MLAHHPVTGQPIHILRTETQISTDQKTLLWLKSSFQPSHRWSRWYSVITEPSAYKLSENITAIVLGVESNLDDWISVLPTILSTECLLVCPLAVADSLEKKHAFTCPRTLLYEDLAESYPYLGEPIAAKDSYEKVIVSIAHILRMNCIAWNSSTDRESMSFPVQMQYDAWIKSCGKELLPLTETQDDSCIPQTWLIQQYFKHSSNRRSREIFTCLEKNVASPYIDHVLLLNEQEYSELPKNPKIQTIMLHHRLTYYDALLYAKQIVPLGAFIILANADMYFNDTLSYLWRISLSRRRLFLSLLRWEDVKEGSPFIYGPRADSQDAWIMSRDSLSFDPTEEDFGFPFGKSCCDNAFSLIMLRKRLLVVNPAYSIKAMHMHASNLRTYDPKDVLYRKHYLYIDPTAIQSCEVEKNLTTYEVVSGKASTMWAKQTLGQSFTRPILGQETDIKTICAMLKRSEQPYNFAHNDRNLWTRSPSQPKLYKFENCFVTANGLVSTFNTIYVGKHRGWIENWERSAQSSLTPSIHIPNLIAYPCDVNLCKSLSYWVLTYLPQVYTLRQIIMLSDLPAPEFLVPQIPEIGSFLQDCVWPEKGNITVNPMIDDMNYYGSVVWAVPPLEEASLVTKEDVDMLRSLIPAKIQSGKEPVAVFCVEDSENSILSREWAEETVERVLPKGWVVHYVSTTDQPSVRRKAFQAASWIFGKGQVLDWMWYANPGATVVEFIPDTDIHGDHIHLAGASGLRYIASLIKREPLPYQRQNALVEVGKAIKKYGFKELLQSIRLNPIVETPTVVVPSGKALSGLWNHTGDAFREMVTIWSKRNYINLEFSEDTNYCWWGSIGEVLLYDRPTTRWWFDLPPYQMAMFGNCAPPGPDAHRLRQSTWCYWGKRPMLIEEMNSANDNSKSYYERTISSLFLGKIENGIQQENRTKQDWSTCVELFSMPNENSTKPYPYTEKEYLQKLCNARFGLCLPGIGAKCNREIECFAAGCVPIVTDGVDMKNYLLMPKEGVHYLRAKTPQDVLRVVKETSAEKWSEMSFAGREWWQAVASAEGLFRLTWARIEQCRPYLNVGIPNSFQDM